MRSRLWPRHRAIDTVRLYRPGSPAVRMLLTDKSIIQLIAHHLRSLSLSSSCETLLKESHLSMEHTDISQSRLLYFLRTAVRELETIYDLAINEHVFFTESELDKTLALEEMLYSLDLIEREDDKVSSDYVNIWEETGKDNFIMDGDDVKAASLNQVVVLLTSQTTEMSFVKTILLTYPSFTSAERLLSKLVERFNIPANEVAKDPGKALAIQLKVGNVLRKWFEDFPEHFYSQELLKSREKFLKSLEYHEIKTLSSLYKTLNNAIMKGKRKQAEMKTVRMFDKSAPSPKINYKTIFNPKLQWHDIDDEEIARQLCLIDFRLFCMIKPSELLNQSWNKPKLKMKALNVLKMINRFNQVSMWAATSILKTPKIKDRAKIMGKLIKVADCCIQLHNYNSAMAIMAALNWSSVYRLRWTRKEISPSTVKYSEDLERLLSSDMSYGNYRAHIAHCNPPCIPYLGVSLTDLTYIDENPDEIKGMINLNKRKMVYNAISKILEYQNTHYNLQPVDQIIQILLQVPPMDEQTLYNLSLKWEPRGVERSEVG